MLLFLVLTAAGDGPVKLALPEVRGVHIDEAELSFYGEHLAQQIKLAGTDVVTKREIASMLSIERQRQLMGCSEAESCMAELADALGTDGVVLADLAEVEGEVQLNLKVISSHSSKTLGAWSERAKGQKAVLDALTRGAHKLLLQLYNNLDRPLPPELVRALRSPLSTAGWVPVAVGAVAAGVGVGLYVSAQQSLSRLQGTTPLTNGEAQRVRDSGRLQEPLGVALMVGGAVVAAAGGAVLVVGNRLSKSATVVGFVPLESGGAFVLGGTFP